MIMRKILAAGFVLLAFCSNAQAAKLSVKPGSADISTLVFVLDSASTSGGGKTGIAYNAAGLACYYARPGSAAAQLALATQTVTGAHSDGGWVEVDATNLPGVYRLDLSDAVCAVGVRSVVVLCKGAAGMAPLPLEIDLAAEVLLSSGTGTGQISLSSGAVLLQPTQTGVTIPTVTTLTGHTAQTGDAFALIGTAGAGLTALGDTRVANLDATVSSRLAPSGTLATVTTTTTATTCTSLTNLPAITTNWLTATGIAADAITAAKVAADVTTEIQDGLATPTNITAGTITTVTGAVGSVTGNVGGSVASVTGAVGSVTGNVGGSVASVTGAVGSVTGLTSLTIADQVWDENLSGHAGVGSTGAALAAAGGSGDPWATTLPGAYGAGTAGKIVGDNLNAPIGTVDTVVDGIVTTLGVAGAGLTSLGDTRIANLDAAVSTRSTYSGGAVASVTGAVGSVTGLTASDVGAIKTVTDGLNALIADLPIVAEFEARTLASADYTVVSDLGTVQSADHAAAIANLPTVAEFTARTAPTTAGAGAEFTAAALALAPTGSPAPSVSEIRAEMESGAGALLPLINAKTTNLPASPAAVGSNMGSVSSVTAPVTAGTVSDKAGYSLDTAPPTAAEVAVAVRDINNTAPAASSLGAAVNSASAAGDPWATTLPGAYGANTAGDIIGNILADLASQHGPGPWAK